MVAVEMPDRDDWERAGLQAVEQGGVDALAVVPLAAALHVTRGSFYWHFKSRDELLEAVLRRWEREHSDALLDALEAVEDPRERLRAMLVRALDKPPSIFVRLLDAADREPLVAQTLARSSARRLQVLTDAYRQAGLTPAAARHDAVLCYAAYVGLAHLWRDGAIAADDDGPAARRERAALARRMVQRFVPPAPAS